MSGGLEARGARAALAAAARRADRLRDPPFLAFALLAALALLLVYALSPRPGTVIIEATTQGASLTFGAIGEPWALGPGTACVRTGARRPSSAPASADTVCGDPALYDAHRFERAEAVWPEGTELELTRTGAKAPLSIRVVTLPVPVSLPFETPGPATPDARTSWDSAALAPGSVIHLDSDGFTAGTVLSFSGVAAWIGLPPGPGANGHLLAGRFQIRESLPLRDLSTTVREGEFLLGDRVGIARRDVPEAAGLASASVSSGFVSAPERTGLRGMQVLLTAPGEGVAVSIERRHARRATVTATPWHRLASDSAILALAALLGFLSASCTVLNAVRRSPGKRASRSTP